MSDEYLTGFRVASPHPEQTRVTLSVLEQSPVQGDFDCVASAIGGSEMIYASGEGTEALEFPAGEGVKLSAGQYVLLVVHLRNPSAMTVSASTRIEGRAGTAREVRTPIELRLSGLTSSTAAIVEAP